MQNNTGNETNERRPRENGRGLTLRINRELAVAVAVREHARGVKLPQGSLAVLLGRASEDLVVVGVVQQAQHLGERQVDVDVLSTANYGSTVQTQSFARTTITDLLVGFHFTRDHARLADARLASRETRVSTVHWYPIHREYSSNNSPPGINFLRGLIIPFCSWLVAREHTPLISISLFSFFLPFFFFLSFFFAFLPRT